jgi:hypothetical protein
MAINRPTTKTIISTAQWGVPITDAVNANTTDVAALKTATAVTPWTALPLQNGWIVSAVRMDPRYRKVGDTVQISGVINGGTPGSTFATMPVGFRSIQDILQVTAVFNGTTWLFAVIQMLATGAYSYHPNSPANPTYMPIQMQYSTI